MIREPVPVTTTILLTTTVLVPPEQTCLRMESIQQAAQLRLAECRLLTTRFLISSMLRLLRMGCNLFREILTGRLPETAFIRRRAGHRQQARRIRPSCSATPAATTLRLAVTSLAGIRPTLRSVRKSGRSQERRKRISSWEFSLMSEQPRLAVSRIIRLQTLLGSQPVQGQLFPAFGAVFM